MAQPNESGTDSDPRNDLDEDIAWHKEQAQACADALEVMPEGPSREAEARFLAGLMRRYQATLQHLLQLKAMMEP